MRGVNRKQGSEKRKIAIFFLLVALLLILANSTRKVYNKKKSAEEALVEMNIEKAELENRVDKLKASEKRLADREGIIFELRKKFSVAGVGESVAVIVEEEKDQREENDNTSLWSKIKGFFLGEE